jgi:hypothetical protein
MSLRANLSCFLTVMFAATIGGFALAQPTPETSAALEPKVTLDQLSTSSAGHGVDHAIQLGIPQSIGASGPAAVSTSEISERADGRSVFMTAVGGEDHCAAPARDKSELCRHRLETKAPQYARPNRTPVTPEARLLLLMNPNGNDVANDDTGRRLGNSTGLNASNGPAQQLAGALRDQAPAQDAAANPSGYSRKLPISVPQVVIVEPK